MLQPQISLIAPVYRIKESYLRQCMDSLVNQTFRDIEIIAVDDGSPDDCGNICDEYAKKDSRVTVIHQENQGVSVARNAGLDAAKGEYVMFVDPDDWLELDCCERVLAAMSGSRYDLVYFQRQRENEIENRVESYPKIGSFALEASDLRKLQEAIILVQHRRVGFDILSPWAKVFRRGSLSQNHLCFPVGVRKAQDMLFNLCCLEHFQNAYFCDYVGYHYRVSDDSVGARYNPEMMDIGLNFLHRLESIVTENHKGEELFERGVGDNALGILNTIGRTLFFHQDHFATREQFGEYMRQFYDDPVVKAYIGKADIRDWRSPKEKVFFLLITGRHITLYYYLYALLRRYVIFKSKTARCRPAPRR